MVILWESTLQLCMATLAFSLLISHPLPGALLPCIKGHLMCPWSCLLMP